MELSHWIPILAVAVIFLLFTSWRSSRPLQTTEKKKDGKLIYRSLSPADGWSLLQGNRKVTLLDVRTPDEFAYSHLPNSINLPLNDLEKKAVQTLGNRNKTILIYCQSGARSKQATKLLYAHGFTNVHDIGGMTTFYKRKPQ